MVSQSPAPNEQLTKPFSGTVDIVALSVSETEGRLQIVPDVRGMSIRKGMNKILAQGFNIDIEGSGKIIEQSPAAGSKQLPGSTILIYCKEKE